MFLCVGRIKYKGKNMPYFIENIRTYAVVEKEMGHLQLCVALKPSLQISWSLHEDKKHAGKSRSLERRNSKVVH